MSRSHDSGSDGSRPAVPLPGQHLAGANPAEFADPERVRAEVDALLSELSAGARRSDADVVGAATGATEGAGAGAAAADTAAGSASAGTDITRRARILEQAHEVLVEALATVDKA